MNIRHRKFIKAKGFLNYLLCYFIPNIAKFVLQTFETTTWWQTLIRRMSTTFKMIDFLYFFYFLRHGGPANFVEKLLGFESIYDRKPIIGFIF